jgi:hypothetical protein
MNFPVFPNSGLVTFGATVDLLTVGTQIVCPQQIPGAGDVLPTMFLPQFCYAALRRMAGPALTTAPKIRLGGNANHNDVAPLYTVPIGATLGVVALIPLVGYPLTPVNLATTSIILEVTIAGVGPTLMVGDLVLTGILISSGGS